MTSGASILSELLAVKSETRSLNYLTNQCFRI
jgi:hypothetical protein